MKEKYDRALCIALLQNKHSELMSAGIKRFPQRSDYTDEEVVAIKAFLGPWPRALEASGLKPFREDKQDFAVGKERTPKQFGRNEQKDLTPSSTGQEIPDKKSDGFTQIPG